jgi:hypothetical protein
MDRGVSTKFLMTPQGANCSQVLTKLLLSQLVCGPIIANLFSGLCYCCPEDQLCGYSQDLVPNALCLENVVPTTPLTLPGPRIPDNPSGPSCPGGQYCGNSGMMIINSETHVFPHALWKESAVALEEKVSFISYSC